MSLRGLLPSCLLMAAALPAAESPIFRFDDLRVGVAVAPLPEVSEKIRTPSGSTSLDWPEPSGYGYRGSVLWLTGATRTNHGFVWGLELSYGTYVFGDDLAYTDSVTLSQAGVDVLAGWQYGITGQHSLRGHLEVLPFVGTGVGWIDKGANAKGLYREYGLRTGAFLSERRWIAGLTASWVVMSQSLDIDTTSQTRSLLDIQADGFRFGLETGYRF